MAAYAGSKEGGMYKSEANEDIVFDKMPYKQTNIYILYTIYSMLILILVTRK